MNVVAVPRIFVCRFSVNIPFFTLSLIPFVSLVPDFVVCLLVSFLSLLVYSPFRWTHCYCPVLASTLLPDTFPTSCLTCQLMDYDPERWKVIYHIPILFGLMSLTNCGCINIECKIIYIFSLEFYTWNIRTYFIILLSIIVLPIVWSTNVCLCPCIARKQA